MTGSTASIDALAGRLATTIRRYREANNMSLGELGRRCGLSKTSLARLEGGDGNPSLETLWRIARALDVSVGELLDAPEVAPIRVMRDGDGPSVQAASGMLGRLLTSDDSRHRTEVFVLALPEGSTFDAAPHEPGSRELVICFEGSVASGPTDGLVDLARGDAVEFPGDRPHQYAARGAGGRAVLVMSYPPHAR